MAFTGRLTSSPPGPNKDAAQEYANRQCFKILFQISTSLGGREQELGEMHHSAMLMWIMDTRAAGVVGGSTDQGGA
jgi:hypothetical protein